MREWWGDDVSALVLTGDTASAALQDIYASGAISLHKPLAPARLRAVMHLILHGEA